jgi:sporulation protein YlmC with PRC-barrel domain
MPRQDWRDDDYMTRARDYRDYDERARGHDRAFFGGDRDESSIRRRSGGWGSLLGDESSGGRNTYRDERSLGPDDYNSGIPTDETERLISSNKVEGTPVYARNGDRLGSIHNFMVDKFRGRVDYAVLKHSSGFLGLDERYFPIEWDRLKFDTRLGGYHLDMTEDQLTRSGSWDRNERWQDRRDISPDRDRLYDRERTREAW